VKIHGNKQLGKQIIKLDSSVYSFYPPYTSKPFVKLLGLANKVIENISRSEEESAIRIIEKKILFGI